MEYAITDSAAWLLPRSVIVPFQGLCVSLILVFLGFCCVPVLHQPVRALLHQPIVFHVEAGLDWVLWLQQFQRPWVTSFFNFLSHSVSVGFYASFLPLLFVLGLPQLTWRLIMLMALCLYVGNAIKDLVCAPRPLAVAYAKEKLKFLGGKHTEAEVNAKEYGLPSSHTMNSICLNYYIVHYLYEHELMSSATAGAAYALVTLWVFLVATSRMYLGMHTPIDILAGAMAGLSVLICYIAVDDYLDSWITDGQPLILYQALISLVLLRLHPKPVAYTPSYEFSVSFMGASFGMNAGVSRTYAQYFAPAIQTAAVWRLGFFWMLRRAILVYATMLVAKGVSRQVVLLLLPLVYRFFPVELRRIWQPPIHTTCKPEAIEDVRMRILPHNENGHAWDVVTTARFLSYASMAWGLGEISLRLLDLLKW